VTGTSQSGAVRGLAVRLAGFTALPFLSLLVPFLLLPVLARVTSRPVWASIFIGQSVGSVGAILVAFGWTLLGPPLLSRATSRERKALYAESLVVRSVLFAVLAPPLGIVAGILAAPEGRPEAVLMALAQTTVGLSVSWYGIGTARPRNIAVYDAAPKIVATVIITVVLLAGGDAIVYPAGLLAASAVGVTLFSRSVLKGEHLRQLLRGRSLRATSRRFLPSAMTDLAATLCSQSALSLASVRASSHEVAVYASGDRLYRIALFSVIALSSTFVSWTSSAVGPARSRRLRIALTGHLLLGFVGLLGLAILGPAFTTLLFGAELATTQPVAVALGAAFLAASLNHCLGRLVVLPNGGSRTVLLATLFGAAVGIPAILIAAGRWGAAGAAAALALSESLVVLALVPSSVRVLRSLGQQPEETQVSPA
jgi:O-antigen/teichoic acid export membrane protein